MKKTHIPFYMVVIAIFIGIISPYMFSDGMFMDGLLYAVISRNLADGLGSFWNLHLTTTLFPQFHEHPPLAFGIESIFFMIFGDNILVERCYSLCTFFITGYLITRIWQKISAVELQPLAWLPLLFWISIPLVTWAASNNMLENTMMIFTTLSVLFLLKSLDANRFGYLALSGMMLFLSFLTKGFVGLFPLSFLFWVYIIKKSITLNRFLTDSTVLFCAVLFSFLLLFVLFPESKTSLFTYFNKQVMGSVQNIETVNSRFFIVWRLLKELIPIGIFSVIILLCTLKYNAFKINYKWNFVFLALGLSGVIPIIISMKQSGFYIIATFPLFAISLASLIAHRVAYLLNKINFQSKNYLLFRYISF